MSLEAKVLAAIEEAEQARLVAEGAEMVAKAMVNVWIAEREANPPE